MIHELISDKRFHFILPEKTRNQRFSGVFRGAKMGALARHELSACQDSIKWDRIFIASNRPNFVYIARLDTYVKYFSKLPLITMMKSTMYQV